MRKCSICGTLETETLRVQGGLTSDGKRIVHHEKVYTEMDELIQDLSSDFKFQPGTVTTKITFCKDNNPFHCNQKALTHNIFTTETVERMIESREHRGLPRRSTRVAG